MENQYVFEKVCQKHWKNKRFLEKHVKIPLVDSQKPWEIIVFLKYLAVQEKDCWYLQRPLWQHCGSTALTRGNSVGNSNLGGMTK